VGTGKLAVNKEVVRRLYEDLFTRGRLELTGELMSEDYVNHDPPPGRGPPEDVRATVASFHDRLVGLNARIDRIAAEGDLMAVQGTINGAAPSGERTTMGAVTGIPLAVTLGLLTAGAFRDHGVFTPEQILDPGQFFTALAAHCPGSPDADDMITVTRSWDPGATSQFRSAMLDARARAAASPDTTGRQSAP
jgi:predicted SnoaL-like aldol condensation-catalyzing enzyme